MEELKFEYVPIGDLKPYENNARKHGEIDIEAIKASIEEFGFNDPIGIWKDQIVEGHGRLQAAKELGLETVPIIRLDHLSDEQRKAYALAHNKTAELSSWDFNVLDQELAMIWNIDMTKLGFAEEVPETTEGIIEDDYTAPAPEDPEAKRGGVWRLGRHVLMCGDSTSEEDVKTLMGGEVADCCVTDPPYNVNYGEKANFVNEYGDDSSDRYLYNDSMPEEQFTEFLFKAIANMKDSLKEGGVFYIWLAHSSLLQCEKAMALNELKIRQQLIWVKNTFVMGRQDYQWRHEPCIYGWKEGAGHYFVDDRTQTTVQEQPLDFSSMKKDELVALLEKLYETPQSIIYENKPGLSKEHPTMKPVQLMAKQIINSTKPGEVVLDLFGGSGTTLIACEQLNRTCYMMEYDPAFVDLIIDRWEKFTGETAEQIRE